MRPQRTRLPLFEIFGALLIGLGLLFVVGLMLNFTRPAKQPMGLVTAVLTIIPAPTDTPILPTPENVVPTTSPNEPAGPGEGVLFIGGYVQVTGTGGDGLRIRSGPGLDYEQQYLGLESEIFEIIAGPQQADNYTWWQLSAPHDSNINGWAVDNFLQAVAEP